MRAVRHTGRCNFSDVAEGLRGMLGLMRWVKEGEAPQGDDLTGDDLRGVGTAFTNPFDEGEPLAPAPGGVPRGRPGRGRRA